MSGRKFDRPFMDHSTMRFYKDVDREKAFFSATEWNAISRPGSDGHQIVVLVTNPVLNR